MTKPLRTHKTVRAVIKSLGGTKRVADRVGVSMPAVSNWIKEGYIPPGLHLQFHLWTESHGERIDPGVFGLDPEGRPLRTRRAA